MANTDYEFIYTVEDYSGVTTSVVMPAGQSRWFDTVTGYPATSVINLVGDGVATIAVLLSRFGATSLIYPIGYVYWQFPGKDSPDDMSLIGTWANISSTFAGDFFRAEGGDASAFDSGEQADAMQRITGAIGSDASPFPALEGVFSEQSGLPSQNGASIASGQTGDIVFDSADSTSPNAAKTDDVETRPVNHTIRLWERTA